MTIGNFQPLRNSDPTTIKRLYKESTAAGLGAIQGSIISGSSTLIFNKYSKFFRNLTFQGKLFYNVALISMNIIFKAEHQVLKFQQKLLLEEDIKRGKLLDKAAENGVFIED
ncbi:Rcf3p NDAI_0E03520 [Naumovozyma dairenensis CBS 421]|uniref:HIG1 domain-containing protein n=1 Tax=Naumovozyma dairenensis (strain ATCC 10597 / BCRC 20456 / CBS 421 / NBRC 0211 / NRRL Y-12639) TaxID=1071378 RepID=G0WBP9_NAUDC|nr:hypothetical protein NDAI_0E03520 [Naumovozyma dairenensis CBS 421]CCD25169.1 hypothetical protein NDAI_0E03520 [Naumovozyma dairenensis CBS 421]